MFWLMIGTFPLSACNITAFTRPTGFYPILSLFVGKKCRYAARRKVGAIKQSILKELGEDQPKHEMWARNIHPRYDGHAPKGAPMPILATNVKVEEESTEIQKTAGTWNVPKRLLVPSWGENYLAESHGEW